MEKGILFGILLLPLMMLSVYALLKFYDEPVRKWLAKKFLKSTGATKTK